MRDWPFLDHDGPIPFAHRGGAADAPENSMEAFDAAIGLGYRYLETDVHKTADGVVVAFHDDRLDRVTDRTGAIAELTWREVSAARIRGIGVIPRLEDLLTAFPNARLNIDPKSDEVVEPMVRVIQEQRVIDRVCVGSFSDARIAHAVERLGPRLCSSLGPWAVARVRAASLGLPTGPDRGACLQVPVAARGVTIVTERFIATCHKRGLDLHVWTIDEADEMERLLDLGVDGIMTDSLVTLRDVLARRGLWRGRATD